MNPIKKLENPSRRITRKMFWERCGLKGISKFLWKSLPKTQFPRKPKQQRGVQTQVWVDGNLSKSIRKLFPKNQFLKSPISQENKFNPEVQLTQFYPGMGSWVSLDLSETHLPETQVPKKSTPPPPPPCNLTIFFSR